MTPAPTTKPRRHHGEGTVRYRADLKRFEARFTVKTIDGKQVRQSAYGTTETAALKAMRKAQEAAAGSTPSRAPRSLTVAKYLKDWLADTVEPRRAHNTVVGYRGNVENHINPAIGHIKLRSLTGDDVQRLLDGMDRAGYAPATTRYAFRTLNSALNHAWKKRNPRLLDENVCQYVEPPTPEHFEFVPLTAEQAQKLIATMAGTRDEAFYAVVVNFGLRRGEALALTWEDVLLDRRELRIRHQGRDLAERPARPTLPGRKPRRQRPADPKSEAGYRVLEIAPWLVELLRRHRSRTNAQQLKAGTRWQANTLVFPGETGTLQSPSNVWRRWKRALAQAELSPDTRLHDLRHTAATLMLEQGIDLWMVSKALGHSTIQVTADIYGHLTQRGRREVSGAMERALRSPQRRTV